MALNISVPASPIVQGGGPLPPEWWQFFIALWNRSGGASPTTASQLLDTITTNAGALLERGSTLWDGLNPGVNFTLLRVNNGIPGYSFVDGNSFAAQQANEVFAGPSSGASAVPAFRALVAGDLGIQAKNTFLAGPSSGANALPSWRVMASADLNSVAGLIPGIAAATAAPAGDVGEYPSTTIPSGSAVPMTSATPTNIGSTPLTAGDWDVWAGFSTLPAGGASQTAIKAWVNTVSVTDPGAPNGGAYLSYLPTATNPNAQTFSVGSMVLQLAAPTTVYLSGSVTYAPGTLGGYGFIGARRRR